MMQSEIAKELSCRITRTLLMYVRERNEGSLGNLLDGLELDEAYLSDTNNWVSHAFLQVLYDRMMALLGDEGAVYKMALASERFQSLGLLDRIVRLVGSPRLIYSQAPKYHRFFRQNGSVIIHELGDNWAVLEENYDEGVSKTRYDCDYTRGVLAGIPTMFGLPLAEVEEIECQVEESRYGHRTWPDHPVYGRPGCIFRVQWSPKNKPPLWRRLFRRHDYQKAIEDLQQANQLIQSKYDEVRQLATDLDQANQRLLESQKQLELQKSELADSESKYRVLAENVNDIISILNLGTFEFDYISPSVERIRGFTPEEAMALSLEQTLSPRSFALAARIISSELDNDNQTGVDPQRYLTLELEHLLKSGDYAWSEITASFIRDQEGRPTAILTVTRDISERKKVEAAIIESEKKYRNLFENGSDLLCIHDLKGNLLETNLPYKEEYGWTKEDITGVNIRELIPDRYKHLFDEYMERILGQGEDEGYLRGFAKDGREVVLEYRNILIYDGDGQPQAVQGAARDVTERINAEKALKESEEKYRELVQFAPAGIYEFDMERLRFTSVNGVMCEYTGYTEKEFLELDPLELIAEESRETLTNLIAKVSSDQENPEPVEYKIRGKNGREFWVLVNSKFFFRQGVPYKAMAVVHDLTAIREAQEEKNRLEVQLQNAQRIESLGTLAGGVAHDFNNLLMGIQGNVSLMLLDSRENRSLYEKLTQIQEYVQRGSDLTRQLLGLGRGGKYEVKATNLNELVRASAMMFGRTKKEISIQFKLAEELWAVEVDRGQIEQVLLNIYVNAWQAMPQGGDLYLETRNTTLADEQLQPRSLPPGRYVQISVTDTGTGMDKETQAKIFDPFFTTKEMSRGTGLGLASSYGIIKNHDGFIEVKSQAGQGSTFTISLPASEKDIEIDEYRPFSEIKLGSGMVLLVDDEDIIINVGRQLLEKLGYDVLVAKSGMEAIDILKTQPEDIDLVILDMIMPDMSGGDTFDYLKAINPDIKVLLSSGYSLTGQATDILKRGCNGFIQKPFRMNELSLKIEEILSGKSLNRGQ